MEHEYERIFLRISSGIYYNDNFKPYDIEVLKESISYFQSLEEYEKCKTIFDHINKERSHRFGYML